jgi:sugar-specific transcriptional regulator TrmB
MQLEQALEQLGLSEKEAKVYLSALELGSANIQMLTDKADIKRSTVNEMIKSLQAKGLILESIKGKRRIFVAAEPERLKQSIKEKEQILSQIIPELKSLNNANLVKPKITYYEGKKGLQEIYLIALEAKNKKADWVSPIQSVFETVGENFLNEYVEKKKKIGYWIRSIHIVRRQVETYKYLNPKTFKETLRDVRFSPEEMDIPNTIGIWDNKVAIISTQKEGFGLIVESADYVKSMKVFYELLWNVSKTWEQMNSSDQNKNVGSEEDEDNKEDDYWSKK